MKYIIIVLIFNSLTLYTFNSFAEDKVICIEQDGTELTVSEVEDAVQAYIEDVPNTDYSTEYDLLIDELCID